MDSERFIRQGEMAAALRTLAANVLESQAMRDAARDVVRMLQRDERDVIEALFAFAMDNSKPEARRVAALERLGLILMR